MVFVKQQDNIYHPTLHDNNHNFDIGNNCNSNSNYNFDYAGNKNEPSTLIFNK